MFSPFVHIPSPAFLRPIRNVMAVVPLAFGAFGFWRHHAGAALDGPPASPVIGTVAYVFAAAMLGVLFLFRRLRASRPVAERPVYSLIGYAQAEAAALFGAIVLFLSGDPGPWLVGIVVLFASWILMPVDPESV
ncbi:MAG TPA: hypothetical protein VFE05_12950 [Longimicrobiaceae bacterium]|jgi:hypothetical protein|nr:hypothetical protein [Longimicrobiaceae bacterium]